MRFVAGVILLGISVGLTGCLQTRSDLKESETKVELAKQVTTLQKAKADAASDIETMQDQLRSTNGRLEVVENHVRMMQANQQSVNQSKQKDREDLDNRLKTYETALDAQEKMIIALTEEVKKLQAAVHEKKAAEATKSSDTTSPFQTAEDAFNKKDWKNAIVSYQKYREANPKGKKFGEATYKIGVCFQELGMNDEAKSFYEEATDKFPSSDAGKKAKFRLQKMKK